MSDVVLIIGNGFDDRHIAEVCNHLHKMSVPYYVFEIPDHLVSLSVSEQNIRGGIRSFNEDVKIDFDDVRSVWNRFKQHCDYSSSDPAVQSEAIFAWREWTDVRASLPYYVAPVPWINDPSKEVVMLRKARQYLVANEVGFRIPDTSLTNDPGSVRRLFNRHRRVIYKPTDMPSLTHNRIIYTTEIDEGTTDVYSQEIAVAPGIYQELIEQDHELRVIAVGEILFAVRIYTDFRQTRAIDRRSVPAECQRFETAFLDPELSGRILDFQRRAGLVYGAYDFIVSTSGEPVFLEVNPRGDWMPMEQRLNLPIAQQMALQLAGSCQ